MASVQPIAGESWDFSDWERGSYEEPHQMMSCRSPTGDRNMTPVAVIGVVSPLNRLYVIRGPR